MNDAFPVLDADGHARFEPVRRVHVDNGSSHIEPPLNDLWDDLAKLQWHAAVVSHDTGLHIEVTSSDSRERVDGEWRRIPGMYCIQVGPGSAAPFAFRDAWTYLNGVSCGAGLRNRHKTTEGHN
jgi:hypothetical protein